MILSLEQLVAAARFYWPAPIGNDEQLAPDPHPEAVRLQELWSRKLQAIARWWAFLDGLRSDLPGFTIGDATVTHDACFRCVAHPSNARTAPVPRWSVVGCLSIIAPVHTVYSVQFEWSEGNRVFKDLDFESHRAESRAPAEAMLRRLNSEFESNLLPPEHARVRVPLEVQWKSPPETLLFHALFTNEPENLF